MPFTILGLGEVLWDVYGDNKFLGGAPANFTGHVTQAGHNGLLLSRVGHDELGAELLTELKRCGLSIDGIQLDDEHETGTVNVTVDANGIPDFTCTSDVAFDYIEFDAAWKTLLSADAVLFGTLAQRNRISRHAIQQFLRETAALKIFDVNLRGWNVTTQQIVFAGLEQCDVIKLNQDELHILKNALRDESSDRDFLQNLLKRYEIQFGAVTLGKNGSWGVRADRFTAHPGFRVNAVDTVGCGDAFAAGLAISLLDGVEDAEILEYGNRLGAYVATRQGAVPDWSAHDLTELPPHEA